MGHRLLGCIQMTNIEKQVAEALAVTGYQPSHVGQLKLALVDLLKCYHDLKKSNDELQAKLDKTEPEGGYR